MFRSPACVVNTHDVCPAHCASPRNSTLVETIVIAELPNNGRILRGFPRIADLKAALDDTLGRSELMRGCSHNDPGRPWQPASPVMQIVW